MQKGELISQCAESKVFDAEFCGRKAILKLRFKKAYRHPVLDQKLRDQRTIREARALVRCRKFKVPTPTVFSVDRTECSILMEKVIGVTARDYLNNVYAYKSTGAAATPISGISAVSPSNSSSSIQQLYNSVEKNDKVAMLLLTKIGGVIGSMHNADIIHGDLTTSNFMVRDEDNDVVVIDFGLVKDSANAEERAVDLYVLERAIASSHPFLQINVPDTIAVGYKMTIDPAKGKATMDRLEAVRARGRKRSMVG
eukprot:Tbor_TRINITY_DN8343_c0_g1::TRINITY_DN8343_c0_g1_i1::g.21057::m.21057/K08851/TP53RK, PRPK, BUD32; TP53 regulating kinase and related kinases